MVPPMAKKPSGNKVLRVIRESLELSQVEFAEATEIERSYLSTLENGHYLLGVDAGLRVYARFRPTFERLGYSLEDLFRSGR